MKFAARKFLPVLIAAAAAVVAFIIFSNPPRSDRRSGEVERKMVVETMQVEPSDYQINVSSYGIVRPRIQTTLVSQVSGQIVKTSESFNEGGYFDKGGLLLTIDRRDYRADVRIAEAATMDARQALAEEQARADQARIDWVRLGNTGEAPELVMRTPQLLAAEARVVSTEANLTKAKLDLERTEIRAPFEGRILRQVVEIGQVVSPNTVLAEIYSTDTAEIRLPINNSDLQFVDFPEGRFADNKSGIPAKIYSELVSTDVWDARIVRTEGAIDDAARQLHVLAEVDAPFEVSDARTAPLKIGQYVSASINGRTLSDAIVIPSKTIYQGSYVYVVEDGLLQRRDIEIGWTGGPEALITGGLNAGDEIITTLLGQVTSGLPVSVAGGDAAPGKPAGRRIAGSNSE